MKVLKGIVNEISEELKPRKLKSGEVVRYQLLTGNPNPDREQRNLNPIIFPVCNSIPAKDRIWDEKKGEFVDIALVENWDKEKNVIPRNIIIWGKSNGGFFACTAGNVNQEELYEYLEICNFNGSNPNRDQSIEPVFKRIDDVKDSKDRTKKRSSLLEALTYAKNLSNGEVRDFAASMNWDEGLDVEVLRDKLEEFAEKDPIKFTQVVEGKDRDVKTILKKAITAGKIQYDTAQHRIVLNNQTLIKLERAEGVDYLTQAADFIMNNARGSKILESIKKLMAEA